MTGVILNEFIDYAYDWLDKVLSVTENGKPIARFNSHNDGQIAQAIHNGQSEDFLWDGLALIHRGENSFINPKHIIEHISANIPNVLDGGDYTVCRENVWFADKITEFK